VSDQPPENASAEELHEWVTERIRTSLGDSLIGQPNNVTTQSQLASMLRRSLTAMQQEGVLQPIVWTRFAPNDPQTIQMVTVDLVQLQLGRYGCTEVATGREYRVVAANEATEQLQLRDGRWVSCWDPDLRLWYRPPFTRFVWLFRDGVRSLLHAGLSRPADGDRLPGPPERITQQFRRQLQRCGDVVDSQVDKRLRERIERAIQHPVARVVY